MPEADDDAGFTLVETMVAIVLVTIAFFALTAELTTYLHSQANDRARATATRLIASSLESARGLTATTLAALPTNPSLAPYVEGGRTFTQTEVITKCSVTDAAGTCTTPSSAATTDFRVRITVSWKDGSTTRSVMTYSSVADSHNGTYSPTGSGTLSTLVGGTSQTASGVSVTSFSATPTSTTVSATGAPASAVTLSLVTVGLTAATTSIPVTWTDDNGSHQVSLTGGPSSWNATVPAASIAKAVSSGTSTLTFAATVPGSSALVTTSVTLRPSVTLSTCTVTPGTITLQALTRKTSTAVTLACTTSGLTSSDGVSVSYPSGPGSATLALSSSNGGSTWSGTLPVGTAMANGVGLSETFTFTGTRASDGAVGAKSVTVVLL